jgi:hypothetical protein
MVIYRATFPDRSAPVKSSLHYRLNETIQERPTSQMVRGINKRDAWDRAKQSFPFETIIIEDV